MVDTTKIHELLTSALHRAERGPQHTNYSGQSEDYRRGRAQEATFQADWRTEWIIPELREALSLLTQRCK